MTEATRAPGDAAPAPRIDFCLFCRRQCEVELFGEDPAPPHTPAWICASCSEERRRMAAFAARHAHLGRAAP